MLAKRMAGILPPLTFEEAIETTKIHSIAGLLRNGAGLLRMRPFRAPHHTISDAGMVGGGLGSPRPGEVSFAHNGLLFLDEFPEFPRDVLEILRQPLEDGSVTIARSNHVAVFSIQFHAGSGDESMPLRILRRRRRANAAARRRRSSSISARFSGPLLDRIDIHVEVPAVPYKELRGDSQSESSAEMRARVERARAVQQARGFYNARMPARLIRKQCALDDAGERTLEMAVRRMGLSARAHDRMLKVARTIADLAGSETVAAKHVAEAVQYRSLDRNYWT